MRENPNSHTTTPNESVLCCPQCGAENVVLLPKKIKFQDFGERLVLVFQILIYALMMFMLSLFVTILCLDSIALGGLLMGVCTVGGGIWGALTARTAVIRSRQRKMLQVDCYRCDACNHLFNHITRGKFPPRG